MREFIPVFSVEFVVEVVFVVMMVLVWMFFYYYLERKIVFALEELVVCSTNQSFINQ